MADVKGLTIEIGADTTKASESLSKVNKDIKSTEKELKQVDNLLKLDPKNTELLNQKQILLNKSIANSNIKLDQLLQKEQDLKQAGVDENSEQFRALQREIVKTNNSIQNNSQVLSKNDKQKKKSITVNKDFIKSATAISLAVIGVAKVVVDAGKKLVEWAVDGAKATNLSQTEFNKFADTLTALEESSKQAKNSIASLLLPALEDLGSKGVDALNQITNAVKSGEGLQGIFKAVGDILSNITEEILEYAPDFIYGFITSVAQMLPKMLPTIITGVVNMIPALIQAIVDSLPAIIEALVNSVFALLESSFNANFKLFENGIGGLFGKGGINIGISLVNGIIKGLNELAHIRIPGLKLFGKQIWDDVDIEIFKIPQIPMLAKGGVVKNGTAIVGEAGAELLTVANGQATVQPLTNNTTNNNYYGGGDQQISINFTGSLSQLARILQPEIKIEEERIGQTLLS